MIPDATLTAYRVLVGYKDLYTGTGDNPINSAIGSHWKDHWLELDQSIRDALQEAGIPRELWGDIRLRASFTVNGKVW